VGCQPTCGGVYSRSRLFKKPMILERPVMRCVIEDVCPGCGQAQVPQATRVVEASTPASIARLPMVSPQAGPPITAKTSDAKEPDWFQRLWKK
jgi:hypothetical protein